ncbi:MAG TPA: hypothetical protein VFP80_15680, partial [Thermoanaerobaculia bacterium]|nr:hypothetical protein [Thermoanaerobaculia bacterium]
ERFQSARDLAFQLRLLGGTQTSGHPAGRNGRQRAVRWPFRVALAGAVVLGAAAVGVLAMRRIGAIEPQAVRRTFQQLTFADGAETFPSLAPDGKSFAYVSQQSGNRDIYVQRVDGRTPSNVTSDSPADDSEAAFSPDGSQIAFRSERDGGGIYLMGVTGESVRRLTNYGHNPSWAPDGSRLVVATGVTELKPHVHPRDSALWIVDARTGADRVLKDPTAGGSDALQPSWSPHGKRIAYYGVGGQSKLWDIFTIDPDAPDPKRTIVRVTSDAALDWNPVWAPDGKSLYFGSNRDGTLNLWRTAVDEETGEPQGEPEPLSLPGQISGNFTVSQDGSLAFATVTRSYRLLALPFDAATARTGTPKPLFGGPQEILFFAPSPDGAFVAFTTAGLQEDLFVAKADGTRVRQLTNDAARDRGVCWSPDGKLLYFYSNRGGASHIWQIAADGSGLARVTDDRDLKRVGRQSLYRPEVSPDGRTLVVLADAGQALVHLDRPMGQRLESLPVDIGVPKWSPDGQRLAGIADDAIVVYSLRTRASETVRRHGLFPQWLPGGQRIAFQQDQSIGVLDLATRREVLEPLAPHPGVVLDFRSVLSGDGATLYVRESVEQGDVLLVRPEKN